MKTITDPIHKRLTGEGLTYQAMYYYYELSDIIDLMRNNEIAEDSLYLYAKYAYDYSSISDLLFEYESAMGGASGSIEAQHIIFILDDMIEDLVNDNIKDELL